MNNRPPAWKMVTCSTPWLAISATSSGQIRWWRATYSSSPPGLSRSVKPARVVAMATPCWGGPTADAEASLVIRTRSAAEDELAGPPADHHRRCVRVDRDDGRHD